MRMCCPKCGGEIYPPENEITTTGLWECEDCGWRGPYPKPDRKKLFKKIKEA